jgi:tetratricopeptide (TPR) repeat protein
MMLLRFLYAAPLLLLLSGTGCGPESGTGAAQSAPAHGEQVSDHGYRALLAKIDRRIAGLEDRAIVRSDEWLVREQLASALLERATLTGSVEDYRRVELVLDEAFALAEEGSGPVLLAARFNYAIHRLDKVDVYLKTIAGQAVPTREKQIGARLLAAQLAFHRGQYEEARAGLREIATASPNAGQAELALYYAKTGATKEAEALLDKALDQADPRDHQRRAWLRLQLGIVAMQSGRYADALSRLKAADADLPGWWLVQEHIAAVYMSLERHGEAIEIYEQLVRETDLPQHLDALARCYEHMERHDEARALIARAKAGWESQLAVLPESAAGHAIEHFLEHGSADRALSLAKQNYATRPGGEAQVLLARAHLKAGQPAAALEILEGTLQSAYRTAALHDAAREAYAALGQTDAAEAQRAQCLALNPAYDGHAH